MKNNKYVLRKKTILFSVCVIDLIGKMVFFILKVFNPPRLSEKIYRILLIRVDHIGDIIMSTAVLKPLRAVFPDAEVDFMAPSWGMDIIKNNRNIDSVVEFDPVWFDRNAKPAFSAQVRNIFSLAEVIKQGNYDVVIDLRGDLRHILAMYLSGTRVRIGYGITGGGFLLTHNVPYDDGIHEIDLNMKLIEVLGARRGAAKVDIDFGGETKENNISLLKEHNIAGSYAVIHAIPGHKTKVWALENFSKVIDHLTGKKNVPCVFVGSGEETFKIKEIISRAKGTAYDLSGKTDLIGLSGIIRKACFFIGVDSAPAHIAAASGIPTIILFSGINDPDRWAPRSDNVRIIYPGKGKFLSDISPEEVFKTIDEII